MAVTRATNLIAYQRRLIKKQIESSKKDVKVIQKNQTLINMMPDWIGFIAYGSSNILQFTYFEEQTGVDGKSYSMSRRLRELLNIRITERQLDEHDGSVDYKMKKILESGTELHITLYGGEMAKNCKLVMHEEVVEKYTMICKEEEVVIS